MTRVAEFGAFVELEPGIEGLAHASTFPPTGRSGGWAEAVPVGTTGAFEILTIDLAQKRIGVAMVEEGSARAASATTAQGGLVPGAIVTGKVERHEKFGVFVFLAPGRTGLMPFAETGVDRDMDLLKAFPIGSDVEVAILEVDPAGRRIRVSKKAVAEQREQAELREYAERSGRKRRRRHRSGRWPTSCAARWAGGRRRVRRRTAASRKARSRRLNRCNVPRMFTPPGRAVALTALLICGAAGAVLTWSATVVRAQDPLNMGGAGPVLYRDRCASCHEPGPTQEASRAPLRSTLGALSRETIVTAMSPGGAMATMAAGMTVIERVALAAFLAKGIPVTADPDAGRCTTPARPLAEAASLPQWNGWGNDLSNSRFQSAAAAGLTPATVPKLTLKWAFGVPGVTAMSGQPTVFGGRVLVGSEAGIVYALDAATGCVRWQFKAEAGVRSAVVVGRIAGDGPARYAAYFGDLRANVYGVDLRDRRQDLDAQGGRARDGADHRRHDAVRRASLRAGVVGRGGAGRPPQLSLLHLPRQRRSARRDHRRADLEDLHHSRGAGDRRQERRRHAAVEAGGRRDLGGADHRRRTAAGLRRHRQRLHRTGGANQRRGDGAGAR